MKNVIVILLALLALQGCQKKGLNDEREAQSLDFYKKNVEIAKAVAEKCVAYENQELSKLPGAQQREWKDSSEGINCQNAKTARSYQIISERQEALMKSDEALK